MYQSIFDSTLKDNLLNIMEAKYFSSVCSIETVFALQEFKKSAALLCICRIMIKKKTLCKTKNIFLSAQSNRSLETTLDDLAPVI